MGNFAFISCRALYSLLYFGVGRSDDSRIMYICDIAKPAALSALGPCPCEALMIVLKGGKAQRVGPNRHALVWATYLTVSAYPNRTAKLHMRHTFVRTTCCCAPWGPSRSTSSIASPHYGCRTQTAASRRSGACAVSPCLWHTELNALTVCRNTTPLFPAERNFQAESTYPQMFKDTTVVFDKIGIHTSKTMHAFRPAAATHLDQAGYVTWLSFRCLNHLTVFVVLQRAGGRYPALRAMGHGGYVQPLPHQGAAVRDARAARIPS
jgi:hypothetical protein